MATLMVFATSCRRPVMNSSRYEHCSNKSLGVISCTKAESERILHVRVATLLFFSYDVNVKPELMATRLPILTKLNSNIV
jgi:hypothetical protein